MTGDLVNSRETVVVPSIEALVEPEMLAWARRSANLDRVAAARKIKVPDDRVEAWESGETAPTIAQLRRASAVYNRALGVFFLPSPPQDFETLRDFRRLDPGQSGEWSTALHAEYRRAHHQRDVLLEISELDGISVSTAWRIGPLPNDDVVIAEVAREALVTASGDGPPNHLSDQYAHLNYWTTALETVGVLVMSTEGGRVDTEEMRAFSLYFDDVPVIVLNGADWPRGRLFSLMHEYSHLLLHTAGLCDTTTDRRAMTENRRIETRCNALAAEILMPASQVLEQPLVVRHSPGSQWDLDDLVEAAKPFGVSVESFFRRLVTLGRVRLADCQGNPPVTVTVRLSEPLGDRDVVPGTEEPY